MIGVYSIREKLSPTCRPAELGWCCATTMIRIGLRSDEIWLGFAESGG
jgi:hypothetical protein